MGTDRIKELEELKTIFTPIDEFIGSALGTDILDKKENYLKLKEIVSISLNNLVVFFRSDRWLRHIDTSVFVRCLWFNHHYFGEYEENWYDKANHICNDFEEIVDEILTMYK